MGLRVEHFHVGQGGFSCVKYDDKGKQFVLIYDCGTVTSKKKVEPDKIFKELATFIGVDSAIDVLVLSHLDEDHINWVDTLLEKHKVLRLVVPYIPQKAIDLFLRRARSLHNDSHIGKFFSHDGSNKIVVGDREIHRYFHIGSGSNQDKCDEESREKENHDDVVRENTPSLEFTLQQVNVDSILVDSISSIQLVEGKFTVACFRFFQPHFNPNKYKQLKSFSTDLLTKYPNSLSVGLKNISRMNSNLNIKLNDTSVGLVVAARQRLFVFTGDMTFNKVALEAFRHCLVGCNVYFYQEYRKLHFQLPHHGSAKSFRVGMDMKIYDLIKVYLENPVIDFICNLGDEPDCNYRASHYEYFVFHGKGRKKHPDKKIIQGLNENGFCVLQITE